MEGEVVLIIRLKNPFSEFFWDSLRGHICGLSSCPKTMPIIIGSDSGETSTKFFPIDAATCKGLAEQPITIRYSPSHGVEEFYRMYVEGIRQTIPAGETLLAIGAAITGEADYASGLMIDPTNMKGPGFKGFCFREKLATEFPRVPSFFINDANALAVAELVYGVGASLPVSSIKYGTAINLFRVSAPKLQRNLYRVFQSLIERICGCLCLRCSNLQRVKAKAEQPFSYLR